MILSSFIFMMGDSDPGTDVSAVAATLIPSLIILWGASKCYIISLRPNTNRKCALALMFALFPLFLFYTLGALAPSLHESSSLPLIRALFLLVALGLSITAIVLAILGLSEYSIQKGVFIQGRSQAIWAIVISILIVLIGCGGFLRIMTNTDRNDISSMTGMPGKFLDFGDINFRIRTPPRPWTEVDLGKINKDSKVSFMRQSPEAYFMIIAESLGADTKIDNAQLTELARAHMAIAASSVRVIRKEPLRINNLDGILVLSDTQIGNFQYFYYQWFVSTNGYAYQLTGYCNTRDRSSVEAEFGQIVSGFQMIDPNRMAAAISSGFVTNYISPSHYYRVMVANSKWHAFSNLKESYPEAEFGGSLGDSCFAIVPVWLGHQVIEPDALAAALLGTLDIKYSDENLIHRQKIDEGGMVGLQYDYSRIIDGKDYRYRIRTFQKGEFGYLTVAWTMRKPESADEVLNDALSRIQITAPAASTAESQLHFSDQDIKNQAYVLNQAGLFYFNSEDYERALPYFKAAAAMKNDDTVYIGNVLLSTSRLNRNKDGLDYIASLPEEMQKKPEVRAFQAYFQSKCSLEREAITNYASIFAEGYRDENDFNDYINLLISDHQYEGALSEVKKFLASGDSSDVRLLIADIYIAMPDYDKAIKFLKDEHDKSPFNAAVTLKLARTLLDADKPNEALEVCQELLKDAPDSSVNLYLKAQCQINLKWYKEAKISLEAAAKIAPSDQDIKESLDYVSGLLGEGDNSMLKTPIVPVMLPTDLTQWPSINAPGDSERNYGACYQQCIQAISYLPHSEYKVTDYLTITVLDTAGVAAFSTYQMPFDPLDEDIFVNDARVLDSSGKLLAEINPSDCYAIDNTDADEASRKKVLNIPVAGLQPGCRISLVITRRSTGLITEFPFYSQTLSKNYPVLGSGVFLEGDAKGLKVRSSDGIKRETLKGGVFLSITNPLVARWEPLQAPKSSFLPMVWISDDTLNWENVASNYLASINDSLQPDENVRLKASQLAGGSKSLESKVAILSRYVQTNCVYKAIEFGRHSRIPKKAADTLRDSYGDCKDLALLLQQLLQAAGVPAHLALVSFADPIQKDMPSLDQFNHMIVEVPGSDGEEFIDCTSKGANLSETVPPGLAKHEVLVLDATNPHLIELPGYPKDDSSFEITQQAGVLDNGDLAVNENLSLTGVMGAYLREYLLGISPAYWQESVQRDMGTTDAEITNIEFNALNDPSQPLQIKYTFIVKDQFHLTPNGMVGRLNAGLERFYLTSAALAHRTTPFENTIPLQLNCQVYFNLPKGYHLVDESNSTNTINSRFISFQSRRYPENGRLSLKYNCQQPVGRYEANDYSSYLEWVAKILAAMDAEIVLQKNGN
jgi:tetratricopeptide (TPR) repeat protein